MTLSILSSLKLTRSIISDISGSVDGVEPALDDVNTNLSTLISTNDAGFTDVQTELVSANTKLDTLDSTNTTGFSNIQTEQQSTNTKLDTVNTNLTTGGDLLTELNSIQSDIQTNGGKLDTVNTNLSTGSDLVTSTDNISTALTTTNTWLEHIDEIEDRQYQYPFVRNTVDTLGGNSDFDHDYSGGTYYHEYSSPGGNTYVTSIQFSWVGSQLFLTDSYVFNSATATIDADINIYDNSHSVVHAVTAGCTNNRNFIRLGQYKYEQYQVEVTPTYNHILTLTLASPLKLQSNQTIGLILNTDLSTLENTLRLTVSGFSSSAQT